MYYIGLDVHKRKISYCVKDGRGQVHTEGSISATRFDLDYWMKTLPPPWNAAMEATMFSGWIYDHLKPHTATLKVAHPLMLRAIAAKVSVAEVRVATLFWGVAFANDDFKSGVSIGAPAFDGRAKDRRKRGPHSP